MEDSDEQEFNAFRRVDRPEHPDRCGAVTGTGDQCWFVKKEGDSKYCRMHAKGTGVARKAKRMYDLGVLRDRADEFGNELSLAEELGLMRLTLQSIVKKGDEVELAMNAGKITMMAKEIRETLKVEHAIRKVMGEVLDKSVIEAVCDELVVMIQKHVGPEHMPAVVDDVAQILARAVARARGDK